MAKTRTVAIISVLLSCLALQSVYGCSCMPSHPQDQYCRADFVIRAKVVDHRFVYVEEPEEEETTTYPTRNIPTTELPTFTVEKEEEKEEEEEEDFDNEIHNEIPLERFKKSLMPLPPLADVEGEIAELGPREPLAQAWKVKLTKIYKGHEFLTKDRQVELFTAPYEGLCGVQLQESVHYVLSGSTYDGKLRIHSCGLTMDYDRLTSRQKQGFSSGYGKACPICRIVPCYGGGCRESADSCTWMPFGPTPDCETLYSKCIERKSGECGWHKNKNFKSCVAVRQEQ